MVNRHSFARAHMMMMILIQAIHGDRMSRP